MESKQFDLCLTCNEAEGYKKLNYTIVLTQFVNCIKKEDPKYKNFYFNDTLQEYRPCYKTCRKCLKSGNPEKHNCLECEVGYMFRPGENPHNNCVVYSEFYYTSSYNQYKGLDVYQCPEEAKYYIKDRKSCIDDCKKDKEYKYLYNGNCIKQCPSGASAVNNTCIVDSNKCILGRNEIFLSQKDDLRIITVLVKTYISEFSYTNHYVSLYQNKNYSILIYKDSSCIKELKLEMPSVDFQSCYSKVQIAYNITEDLIIVIVDKKESQNPTTFYSFYHPKAGAKLDADTICKDEVIVVVESLNSVLDQNSSFYETQTSLASQGINIFDLNDPFFTDICYDFDNPIKKDIPLNDRVKDIYPDASLCDEGCQYKGVNLEDMTSTCDCKFNDITNSNLIKDNALINEAFGGVLDLINNSNIMVFKCSKYIFKHFSRSIGGWISLTLLISHTAMVSIFIFIGNANVTKYIFSITQNYISIISKSLKIKPRFPPRKAESNKKLKNKRLRLRQELNTNANNNINNNNSEKDLKDAKRRKSILIPIALPKYSKDDLIIRSNEKEMKDTDANIMNLNTISQLDNIDIEFYIDPKKYGKQFFKEYLETSLDDLEFDDAVVKDKRKYCEHMRENLLEDQILANTFIADDPIKPRSIKVILLILNFILYFVVNALFINDEVVSDLYNADESEEHFFSYFKRSINRLIYATIVSVVVAMITDFFFIDEGKIKGILKREKNNKIILKKKISELINNLKKRYIAFIIIVSVILLLSFFYLLCFNYVYPYTQIEWLKSSITIMIIMQILYTLKCILEISLRFLSFRFKSEKLYKISKFLD